MRAPLVVTSHIGSASASTMTIKRAQEASTDSSSLKQVLTRKKSQEFLSVDETIYSKQERLSKTVAATESSKAYAP